MISDPIAHHRKFGYSVEAEKRAIRERLLAEGYADDVALFFAVEQAYINAHRDDETYRDRCSRRVQEPVASPKLSPDQIDYLLDHFVGANDPFVQQLVKTLQSMKGVS